MSDQPTDLYAVLGLDPSATQAQIRRAFRGLLRRHHPDTRAVQDPARHAASDDALQQALAAYAKLGDPSRRALYDQQSRLRSLDPGGRAWPPQPRPEPDLRPVQPPIQAGPVRWHRAQPDLLR